MNRAPQHGYTLRRRAQSGLPWLGVVAMSVSVAYAMTVAVAGGAPAGDEAAAASRTAILVTQAPADAAVSGLPGWSPATAPTIDRVSRLGACEMSGGRLLYVGLNSWIPAEPMVPACPESAP
jgi:hypothetical protein